jgi:hypothetical protein
MEIPAEEERLWTFSKWSEFEIPCRNCGGRYEVSLKKIALS